MALVLCTVGLLTSLHDPFRFMIGGLSEAGKSRTHRRSRCKCTKESAEVLLRLLGYGRAVELGGTDRAKAHEIIHDLRNALGLVINYANLVAGELADRPDILEDLMEIRTAGRRAAELVGELSTVVSPSERPREEPLG